MIVRIWHGWTSPENADAYENLLIREVFKEIEDKLIDGFRKIELLRRTIGDEVEFVTVMRFDTVEDVKKFVGQDYEQAYVPAEARKLLKRFDQRSEHFELRESREYPENS